MNPCFLTPRGTKTYESIDEVRAAWTDGAEFRIYMYGNIITKAESNRLLRAKFTHVRIVWQTLAFRIMHVDIELKEIH